MFYEAELITLKKNFLYITFPVSDLRCDSILWNSIWQLENFETCLLINGLPILIGLLCLRQNNNAQTWESIL